jgi:hypothetical protein
LGNQIYAPPKVDPKKFQVAYNYAPIDQEGLMQEVQNYVATKYNEDFTNINNNLEVFVVEKKPSSLYVAYSYQLLYALIQYLDQGNSLVPQTRKNVQDNVFKLLNASMDTFPRSSLEALRPLETNAKECVVNLYDFAKPDGAEKKSISELESDVLNFKSGAPDPKLAKVAQAAAVVLHWHRIQESSSDYEPKSTKVRNYAHAGFYIASTAAVLLIAIVLTALALHIDHRLDALESAVGHDLNGVTNDVGSFMTNFVNLANQTFKSVDGNFQVVSLGVQNVANVVANILPVISVLLNSTSAQFTQGVNDVTKVSNMLQILPRIALEALNHNNERGFAQQSLQAANVSQQSFNSLNFHFNYNNSMTRFNNSYVEAENLRNMGFWLKASVVPCFVAVVVISVLHNAKRLNQIEANVGKKVAAEIEKMRIDGVSV